MTEFKEFLTLKMENPRAIENSASSETMEIGGFKWRMEVQKTTDVDDAFMVQIHCNELQTDSLWMCHAQFHVHVQQGRNIELLAEDHRKFAFFNGFVFNSWPLLTVWEWDFDEPINLEFELVKLDKSSLGRNMPALETNLQINFGGKEETVGANKFILAGISNYFRNLFFGEWAERNNSTGQSEKFVIGEESDFDVKAFKLMLNSAQLMGWMIHESNFLNAELAFKILKMSIKYDLAMVQDYCEKYLAKAKDFSKMELLLLVDEFGILSLKDHCLASITPSDFVSNIGRNTEIRNQLTEQTRSELDAKLEQKAKGGQNDQQRQKKRESKERNGFGAYAGRGGGFHLNRGRGGFAGFH